MIHDMTCSVLKQRRSHLLRRDTITPGYETMEKSVRMPLLGKARWNSQKTVSNLSCAPGLATVPWRAVYCTFLGSSSVTPGRIPSHGVVGRRHASCLRGKVQRKERDGAEAEGVMNHAQTRGGSHGNSKVSFSRPLLPSTPALRDLEALGNLPTSSNLNRTHA